ncbi:hypothetical protein JCM19237_3624 [Photobacterium aphoticum]|uniref:Uncharacterized protein n=1 Tax=Photobacterium aphoticum TaxID=754436 RepID=A0A090QQP1_9GAMM|nr:hypothetical protein JCM19237_3624 [Photobacterium aphoticum]
MLIKRWRNPGVQMGGKFNMVLFVTLTMRDHLLPPSLVTNG